MSADGEIECMCLHCGVSSYVDTIRFPVEITEEPDGKVMRNIYCQECGGPLLLLGKAGDQPHYRLS